MTKIDRMVPIIGSPTGEADLRIYNVIVYCGYVESHRHAPLIFQHESGFPDAKEALLHLHESIATILNRYIDEDNWEGITDNPYCDYPEDCNLDVEALISELQPSMNDGTPGGYDFWEDIQTYGWTYQGNLVTGICVTLLESGEKILASKNAIINHCNSFEGKFVPSSNDSQWPMCSDLDLQILIVSKIPKKEVIKPEKK